MRLWSLCQTQWRTCSVGLVGLDWPAVLQIAALHGITVGPSMFRKIQALEIYEITRKVEVKPDGS